MTFWTDPWPWWIAGPLIGLMVPAMLWISNRTFGVSSNLRHLCAAALPARVAFLRYDWRRHGLWNLTFAIGIALGAGLTGAFLMSSEPTAISEATRSDLAALGITQIQGWLPSQIFNWNRPLGLAVLGIGGFLVGFGSRYAGGCTSGHAITGLSFGRLSSLIAVIGFFAGGLISAHLLWPFILGAS